MFPLSYNTDGLMNISLERAIEELSKAGYQGIEISLHHLHLHPYEVTKQRLIKLKDLFSKFNIVPVALDTGGPHVLGDLPFQPSLISADRAERQKRIDFLSASLGLANELLTPVLVFSGGVLTRDFICNNVSEEEAKQMLSEGIRICLRNAGNVIMALEPEATLHIYDKNNEKTYPIISSSNDPQLRLVNVFLDATHQAIPIIREINSPQFRLNLDISHARCYEPDFLQRIAEALPYTRNIHIADIKSRIHHHEIPGEGDIDFRSVFRLLREAKYEHYVSVELYWHSDVWEKALYQSRKYLQAQMETVKRR